MSVTDVFSSSAPLRPFRRMVDPHDAALKTLATAVENSGLDLEKGRDFRLSGSAGHLTVHYWDGRERQRIFVPRADKAALAEIVAKLNAESGPAMGQHFSGRGKEAGTDTTHYRL